MINYRIFVKTIFVLNLKEKAITFIYTYYYLFTHNFNPIINRKSASDQTTVHRNIFETEV